MSFLNIKKENHLSIIPNLQLNLQLKSNEIFLKYKTAMVNEPSLFEPLKFYCIWSEFLLLNVFSALKGTL